MNGTPQEWEQIKSDALASQDAHVKAAIDRASGRSFKHKEAEPISAPEPLTTQDTAAVKELVESASTPDPAPATHFYSRTDVGNGQLFATLHHETVQYDCRRKLWLVWSRNHWRPDALKHVDRLAKAIGRERMKRAYQITDEDKRSKEQRWAMESESGHHVHQT